MIAKKDELELVSGINCKNEARKAILPTSDQPLTKDLLYHKIEVSLEFKNREEIESIRNVDIEVINGKFDRLDRTLTWTGSSYDKSELIKNEYNYSFVDSKDHVSPYHYQIILNNTVSVGQHISYGVRSVVKDESHLMHAYFAQIIKYPTRKLILKVIIPNKAPLLDNIHYVRYADMKMEYDFPDQFNEVKENIIGDEVIYQIEIDNPNLFYTYSLEWDFVNVKS